MKQDLTRASGNTGKRSYRFSCRDLCRTSTWLLAVCCLGFAACDKSDPLTSDDRQVPIESFLDSTIVVTPNPSGTAPLTAEAAFRTKVPALVSLEVLGEEPLTHQFGGLTTEHVLPVLGLYPGVPNHVIVQLTDAEGYFATDTLSLVTEPLPDFFPDIEIVTADKSRMEEGWNLSSFSIGNNGSFLSYPFIFDTNGDIRWYLDLASFEEMVVMVERLANGNLLFGVNRAVYEYDMLGRLIHRWDLPGYVFHHDVIEKPNGNLIVSVNKEGVGSVEDHIIELDVNSGAIIREWDLRQILDVNRRDLVDDAYDWFHMNAAWYSEADDALIISGRNQGVVKVTSDNELVWILAPHQGWGKAGLNKDGHDTAEYLLTAVDASGNPFPDAVQQGVEGHPEFQWPWGQHAPVLLPNGNLFLFDNGYNRNFAGSTNIFSRGVEYRIDESNMTVQQVWQYGEERGEEFFSSIISDVDFLPGTGNRLIMPGIIFGSYLNALVTEVTYPGGNLIFEADIRFKNRFSSGTLAWGQFDMVYRSERLTLYPLPRGSQRLARLISRPTF